VREIDGIGSSILGRNRVLLGQDEAHDLAQLDVVDEEVNMNRVWGIFCRFVRFVFHEVVFGNHLDVGVFWVDCNWPAERDCYRSVSGK
jgi:hypothetical protein